MSEFKEAVQSLSDKCKVNTNRVKDLLGDFHSVVEIFNTFDSCLDDLLEVDLDTLNIERKDELRKALLVKMQDLSRIYNAVKARLTTKQTAKLSVKDGSENLPRPQIVDSSPEYKIHCKCGYTRLTTGKENDLMDLCEVGTPNNRGPKNYRCPKCGLTVKAVRMR